MVLQKRLDYGFNGYQVPATPRATRSARKRCPFKKRLEDNQMCPFDILASLAGKILHSEVNQTNKTSTEGNHVSAVRDSVKSERQNDFQSRKIENCDEDNCEQRSHNSELMPPSNCKNYSPKRSPSADKDSHFQRSPVIGSYHCNKLQDVSKGLLNNKSDMEGTILMDEEVNTCHVEDMVACDGKPAVLHGSNGSAREASCGNQNSHRPGPASQDDVNVFSEDDGENSSSCTQPNTVRRKCRPTPQIGDRRIRKVLASKRWNAPPKFNDVSCSSFERDLKAACCERENYFKRLRCERNFPIKKRKFFHPSLYSKSDGGLSSQGTSESPGKHIHGDFSCSRAKMHEGSGVPYSVAKHRPFNSSDSNVKLKIKSFRVPELFIEIPETATVGLLKRTVMEAVTAILRGGLRIGMLLQGKKVKDDNKTLLQTGISQGNQSNSLGFSLESDCFQTLQRLSPEGSHFKLYLDDPCHPNRSSTTVVAARGITSTASPEHLVSNLDKQVSAIGASTEKSNNESKALVPLVGLHAEALAVLPAQKKSKRPEVVQRRIRRPFSVAEVEALVQAVEELGTGRWRDVKLKAFDKAKHRTYVDLKDKWKTLVHTAGISPQQRRGEPVPQELLDRVLTAHAYWSQQQAKQQLKQHSETCLLT